MTAAAVAPKPVKVRLLENVIFEQRHNQTGDELEVPAEVAADWIKRELAEKA